MLSHFCRITHRHDISLLQSEVPKHFTEPVKMMASEAMVETMVRQKVNTVFGIVGSAFMDALDLFPEAGIRFLAGEFDIVFTFPLIALSEYLCTIP